MTSSHNADKMNTLKHGEHLVDIHTQLCTTNLSFAQSCRALCTHMTSSPPHSLPERNDDWRSLDAVLAEVTKCCLIISPAWIEKDISNRAKLLEAEKEKRYSFFVFKNLNLDTLSPVLSRENDQQWNPLHHFFSLGTEPTRVGSDREDENRWAWTKVLQAIAQIVARETVFQASQSSSFVSMGMPPVSSSFLSSEDGSIAKKKSGRAYYFPRRILSTLSYTLNRVMVSLDLVDDIDRQEIANGNSLKGNEPCDDDDHEDDDANHVHDGTVIDEDDAECIVATKKASCDPSGRLTAEILMQDDNLWNVHILIHCWKIIVHHAKRVIQYKKEQDDTDGLTTIHNSNGVGAGSGIGILLNRYGEESGSFLFFCQEAGRKLVELASLPEENITDIGIAKMLKSLQQGCVVDILLSLLLATNKAKLSTEHDVVILLPSSDTAMLQLEGLLSCNVNDVDVAIFKISCARQTLERRLEHLQEQMEGAYKKALIAKQQAKNVNLAMMHLKRRNMYQQEVEACLSSLMNLDKGLHTIKRTRGDIELLKTYELINLSLKAIQQETDLEQVVTLMQDLEMSTQDLNEIHNVMNDCMQDDLGLNCQDDDIERELNELINYDSNGEKTQLACEEALEFPTILTKDNIQKKQASSIVGTKL